MVGRNDPCPCGSGKKYKKCCSGKNEVFLDKQVDQDLNRILYNSFEVISKQVAFDEFETYTNSWKEEVGTLWDMKSIEEAVSAYYILISRSDLWKDYLSDILNETLRSNVRQVLETWKEPIILLGNVVAEQDGYLEIKELIGSETYYLKQNEKMALSLGMLVLGIVLPQHKIKKQSVKIVSSLMCVRDDEGALESAIQSFSKMNHAASNANFLEENMLDIYAILLGRPMVSAQVGETIVQPVVESSEEPIVEPNLEPLVEPSEDELTPIQNETIELLNSVLEERNTNQDEKELINNICVAYFIKNQPNFRKANVVAAAAFVTALDLELLTEEPMTKTAAAKLFDVSPASMASHIKNIQKFVEEDYLLTK